MMHYIKMNNNSNTVTVITKDASSEMIKAVE